MPKAQAPSSSLSLPVSVETEALLRLVAGQPGAFFLDSSDLRHPGSGYSYFSFKPSDVLTGPQALADLSQKTKTWMIHLPEQSYWAGGYFGSVSYEGEADFGYYPAVVVKDEKKGEAWVASQTLSLEELRRWRDDLIAQAGALGSVQGSQAGVSSQWRSYPTLESYLPAFHRIQEYLAAGDVYQINLTREFRAKTCLTPDQLYRNLRFASPSPYGAFVNSGRGFILSASPELLFTLVHDQIRTKPIKGTRQNLASSAAKPGELDAQARELLDSAKDRAELLMITDLERNDLGRVCETGSVQVEKLCALESFATVHHLVSTISGRLKKGLTLEDVFKALFPGGSVTGAPKIRAMQIIDELERRRRGIYTGALGFIGPGMSLFNLPIRTMVYEAGGDVRFATGGGIVVDSVGELEYEELWWKAAGMMRALGLSRMS